MSCLFQALSAVACAMGEGEGGLLEMGMGQMPVVVRELPSKVDVVQTFYKNVNREEKATGFQSGLSTLGVALCEELYEVEEGFADGV
jgi:hypothetical protein